MEYADLVKHLKDHDLLVEGNRNNDSVNLAILGYERATTPLELFEEIAEAMKREGIKFCEDSDVEYLEEKCAVLIDYVPSWADVDRMAYVI